MINNLEFEKRIVVFIDILGFGSLVERAAKDQSGKDSMRLHSALSTIKSTCESISISPSNQLHLSLKEFEPDVHQFSDSIILSLRSSVDAIQPLANTLCRIFILLMKQGIFIRGGISNNLLSKDRDAPCGPAVNEAYQTENMLAIWPRIVLSASMFAFINSEKPELLESSAFERDKEEGLYQLTPIQMLLDEPEQVGLHISDLGARIKSEIDRQLLEIIDKPNIYKKIRSLADDWSFRVSKDPHGLLALRTKGYSDLVSLYREGFSGLPSLDAGEF